MLNRKTMLLFLLKAVIIYALLAAPLSVYDEMYGNFYRKIATVFFSNFRENGFTKFREWKKPELTHVNLGSNLQIRPDGTSKVAFTDINTRYLGYLPTILLISLVLASPVPWKRRLIALAIGLILVTLLVMFKQWIALLWLSEQSAWLELTHFTGTTKKLFAFTNTVISDSASTVLYFVVAIWLLVTFRTGDFKIKKTVKQ